MQSYPRSLRQSLFVLGAVLAVAVASGCTRTTHVHQPPAPPGPALFFELEPNDHPDFPDFVAVLDRDSYLAVQGSVEAVGFDIVDHIEFQAAEPMELDFYLGALSAYGDVDVSIYDPIAGVILSTYAYEGDEWGTLVIHEPGRPFQFVIEAYLYDLDWDLELTGYPYFGRSAAPGAASDSEAAAEAGPAAVSELEAAEPRPWIEFVRKGA